MATKTKIDFKITPKVTWITSDAPDYDDFVDNWNEAHDGEVEPPAEGSQEFWDAVNDDVRAPISYRTSTCAQRT